MTKLARVAGYVIGGPMLGWSAQWYVFRQYHGLSTFEYGPNGPLAQIPILPNSFAIRVWKAESQSTLDAGILFMIGTIAWPYLIYDAYQNRLDA